MVIRFEDVAFRRGDAPPVLSGLDLTIASGAIVAIVGRSGVGKTTLLKLVNRLLLPTRGTVLIDGRETRDWDGIRLRRRIGYVFQDIGLFPHMTVEDNVTVVPRLERWAADRSRARARDLLHLVGLPPDVFAARRPDELSGGQRQRVGLARALAADPPVLLMDEPFAALDEQTRLLLQEELLRLWEGSRRTVVYITHSIEEAVYVSDRVVILSRRPGRVSRIIRTDLATAGAPDEIRRDKVYLDTVEEIWQMLKQYLT